MRLLMIWVIGFAIGPPSRAQEPDAPVLTLEERQALEQKAEQLNADFERLHGEGQLDEALEAARELLTIHVRLHAGEDHPDVATSLSNLGVLLLSMGDPEAASPCFRDALDMERRLHGDQDHPDVAMSLSNLGASFAVMGQFEQAIPPLRASLEMRRRLYPDQAHPGLATSFNNLGYLLKSIGEYEEALSCYREALEMQRQLLDGQDHFNLASTLNNIGVLLKETGKWNESLQYYREALEMTSRLCDGQDHPDLAGSLSNMGALLESMGDFEAALPFFEDALKMLRRLHEDQDHPDLATSLNNMGFVLAELGDEKAALPYHREALEMSRRLAAGRDDPSLAQGLNNMGSVFQLLGDSETAVSLSQEALEMNRRLYAGQDHPSQLIVLNNMALLFNSIGNEEESLRLAGDALEMSHRLSLRFAESIPVADALEFATTVAKAREVYLGISRQNHHSSPANIYAPIWATKEILAHTLRKRHRLSRLQQIESEEVRILVAKLQQNRRRLTALLLQPADEERDQLLSELTEEVEGLERALVKVLPRGTVPIELELSELTGILDRGVVFVDLYRYNDWAVAEEAGENHYVAFVLTHDGEVQRVELGPAEPIESALTAWRRALVEWSPQLPPPAQRDLERQAEQHAASLREHLWGKIEAQLPADTRVIYISPDEDLARLPFAALPGAEPGSVLLDQYAIAVVPSAPFLLEQLGEQSSPTTPEVETLLAIGGVEYGSGEGWLALEATASEQASVCQLAGDRPALTATGSEATTDWLIEHLPQAHVAHLATHGFFNEAEFAEEQARLQRALGEQLHSLSLQRNLITERGQSDYRITAGAGRKNPIGYVGLVMAGANGPPEDSLDGGIASGLAIMDLDLSRMELAVLSACDTGLGEHTGGTGVLNLQLAFHVAGCENVIASLWKVNDKATAALMAKFYHGLWVEKLPPIEALRQAQLLLMRRPDLIDELSGERGRPAVEQAVLIEPGAASETPQELRERLPPKYWAAFVLSGIGR